MKVGRDKVTYMKGDEQKERKFAYRDVEYDKYDWVDASKYLPADFDLMHMRTDKDKTYAGWHATNTWMGLRLPEDEKVLYWKRNQDDKHVAHKIMGKNGL